MNRILHIGDSHFEDGSRFEECVRVHDWIVDLVERERPDIVIHAGDLYTQASTPVERLAAGPGFVQRLAQVCPVLMARGNHDKIRDLELLSQLRSKHSILVEERAGVHRVGDVAFILHAWPNRLSTIDDEGARQAIRSVLVGLADEADGYPWRILAGHFQTDGALSGAGQPLIGAALSVSIADFMEARPDAVLLSHIHRAQDFPGAGVPISYAGSPFRTSYGELEEKSVTMLHLDEPGRARIERIPTPARPMYKLRARWDVDACDLVPVESFPEDMRGADVSLVCEMTPDHADAARARASELEIAWNYAGAAHVKKDFEVLVQTRARVPEIASKTTIADQLRAMWDATGTTPEPARADRLTGPLLEQIESEVKVA